MPSVVDRFERACLIECFLAVSMGEEIHIHDPALTGNFSVSDESFRTFGFYLLDHERSPALGEHLELGVQSTNECGTGEEMNALLGELVHQTMEQLLRGFFEAIGFKKPMPQRLFKSTGSRYVFAHR
jgi:hypothetical protein